MLSYGVRSTSDTTTLRVPLHNKRMTVSVSIKLHAIILQTQIHRTSQPKRALKANQLQKLGTSKQVNLGRVDVKLPHREAVGYNMRSTGRQIDEDNAYFK